MREAEAEGVAEGEAEGFPLAECRDAALEAAALAGVEFRGVPRYETGAEAETRGPNSSRRSTDISSIESRRLDLPCGPPPSTALFSEKPSLILARLERFGVSVLERERPRGDLGFSSDALRKSGSPLATVLTSYMSSPYWPLPESAHSFPQ